MKAFFSRYFWLACALYHTIIAVTSAEFMSPKFIGWGYLGLVCLIIWHVQRKADTNLNAAIAAHAKHPPDLLENIHKLTRDEKKVLYDEACARLEMLNSDLKSLTFNFSCAALGSTITYLALPDYDGNWLLLVWAFSFSISASMNYTSLTKKPRHEHG